MFQLLLPVIYLSFISLGLPDSLLGAAWPSMYQQLSVPFSFAGILSMIIAVGTVVSSLQSHRFTQRYGTGKVTAVSVLVTALSLLGFSFSHSYWLLCLWAVPYGLGAGGVDASLNNYVALHYKSRHMSWLHCMWGIGASLGPAVIGAALANGGKWNAGYRYIGILQIILTVLLFFSLPLWKKDGEKQQEQMGTEQEPEALCLRKIIKRKGIKEVMIAFFCYSAIEQTAGLWASSYFTLNYGLSAEKAAGYASLFFVGITVGRGISGFITIKLSDSQMVRLGQGLILAGILLLFLPFSSACAIPGLIFIGLGCAPVYPCLIHSTPAFFGRDYSQSVIGLQMASAYAGTCLMPPCFGILAEQFHVTLLPWYLFALLLLMMGSYGVLLKKCQKKVFTEGWNIVK